MELMAQMEMEEDDIPDFASTLPPKLPSRGAKAPSRPFSQPPLPGQAASRQPQMPPAAHTRHSLQQELMLPATAPAAPVAPRGPAPGRRSSHASIKAKSKYQDRDALVNCILNDDPPSRATTPRGTRTSDGRSTPRGSSLHRTPLKPPAPTPPLGVRRSQSYDIHFNAGGRRTPPTSMKMLTPRGGLDALSGGKSAGHYDVLDILNMPGDSGGTPRGASKLASLVGQPDSPRRSEASSASSLPQLNEKRAHARKPPQAVAPSGGNKSARSWREQVYSS